MMQGPPAAPPDNISFSRFTGLRNTISSERLAPEELELARDVDLDDIGQIHRRRGFTRKAVGNFHSLFGANDGTVYGVKDGELGIANPNYSFVGLQAGIGPDPLAYVQVGPVVYFSSLSNSGQISQPGNVVTPWGEAVADFWFSPVVNPTPSFFAIKGRLFGSPPMASVLEYFNGRIYLGSGRTIWATELYLYNFTDKTKNYWQFEAEVTMIAAATDGLYVGTTSALYFVTGPAFAEMKRVTMSDVGVLPGTLVTVPRHLIDPNARQNLEQAFPAETVNVFMTTDGLVVGMDGGQTYNLTQTKVIFPEAQTGAALFRKQDGVNQVISVLDSRGTPTQTARIGDFLEATLIRGNGES